MMQQEITCKRMEDDLILVNGKEFRKDMNGNWCVKGNISINEASFFHEYREMLERNPSLRNLEVTYKI